MSEENAAGECAGDWFACMGFMKIWMFSLSGPWMALKRCDRHGHFLVGESPTITLVGGNM